MTQATDTDIRELKTAIADLTTSVTGLREEMQVGFGSIDTKFIEIKGHVANLDTKFSGQITNLDTKLSSKIDNEKSKLSGEIGTLTEKFDERTKGLCALLDDKQWNTQNVSTGLTVTIVGGILLTLIRFLFFDTSIKSFALLLLS
jgi:hypothetical protein